MKKYKVQKTYKEINEKIKSGKVVVVTAEEIIDIVKKEGPVEAARKVDVVTTGTFAPMCSFRCVYQFRAFKTRHKSFKSMAEQSAGLWRHCCC